PASVNVTAPPPAARRATAEVSMPPPPSHAAHPSRASHAITATTSALVNSLMRYLTLAIQYAIDTAVAYPHTSATAHRGDAATPLPCAIYAAPDAMNPLAYTTALKGNFETASMGPRRTSTKRYIGNTIRRANSRSRSTSI